MKPDNRNYLGEELERLEALKEAFRGLFYEIQSRHDATGNNLLYIPHCGGIIGEYNELDE